MFTFVAQPTSLFKVGDGDIDHQFWGRPEDMTMPRPCLKIGVNRDGSDVAADYAAALAAGSIVFREKGGSDGRLDYFYLL